MPTYQVMHSIEAPSLDAAREVVADWQTEGGDLVQIMGPPEHWAAPPPPPPPTETAADAP